MWRYELKKNAQREEKKKQEAVAQNAEQALKRHEEFCRAETQREMDSLSESERTRLTKQAIDYLEKEFPESPKFEPGHIVSVERRIVSGQIDLPDFASWEKDLV